MKNLEGFLTDNITVFGDPHQSGYSSCGFSIVGLVYANSSINYCNQLEAALRTLERQLKPGMRMQVAWNLSNDCSEVLLDYYDRTNESNLTPFVKGQRHERFARFSKRMEEGLTRFESVTIYFSRPFSLKGGDESHLLKAESESYQILESDLRNCFQGLGATVRRLNTKQLFERMYLFCNPSQSYIPEHDPSQSLLMNCLTSEGNAVVSTDAGFYMDGKYHGCLTLKSLPQSSYSGLIQQLTGLPLHGFAITTNVIPLDAAEEIQTEEVEIEKIRKSLRGGKQQRSVTALDQRIQRLQRLVSNEEVPFKAQILLRVWADDLATLQRKLGALKSAITRMQFAKSYSATMPTTARNYFRASFPGWCWDRCQDFYHLIEDAPLSNLLPVSGSPVLGRSDALYDGANGNLIGVNSFLNGAPQHAMVVGRTGSGKSAFLIDFLTQTSPGISTTIIVDNGLSYQTYCQANDPTIQPLIIKPNGVATFNYLDFGEPLSAEHLIDAVAIAHEMAGRRPDEDTDRMRRAVLSYCLNEFLTDHSQDWFREDPERRRMVGHYAVALEQMNLDGLAPTLLEQHRRFTDWALTHPIEAEKLIHDVSERECDAVSFDVLWHLSFAFMSAEQVPRHSQFQQWLELASMGDASEHQEIGELAILLKSWCAEGGTHGPIFDGVHNVSLKGGLVHLELGQCSDLAPEFLKVAMLVLLSLIKNQIFRLPRNQRKRVVFEELSSFITIAGEKVVREFYETMRKYNAQIISVVQQLRVLGECGASLLGNIRMAFLLKQSSTLEIDLLEKIFELPESARETLTNFPEPSREWGAPFLLWKSGTTQPEMVTGYHVASNEMLYVSSSSGEHYEERKQALAKYDDVLTGIMAEAAKMR